jgi:hypothetical protein
VIICDLTRCVYMHLYVYVYVYVYGVAVCVSVCVSHAYVSVSLRVCACESAIVHAVVGAVNVLPLRRPNPTTPSRRCKLVPPPRLHQSRPLIVYVAIIVCPACVCCLSAGGCADGEGGCG